MYKTIICAVGLGSRERAEHLLRTAHSLLEPRGRLRIVHIVESVPSSRQGPDEWALAVIGEAEENLALLCKRLAIPASVDVRTGRAADTILTIATEIKADLIVMAAHSPDILDHVFGSTVDHVAHHAKCSIHIDRIFHEAGNEH